MTTTPKTPTTPTTSARTGAAKPVPTRITELAPLVVQPEENPAVQQITESLEELAVRMAEIHAIAAEGWINQGNYEKAIPHLVTSVTFAPQETGYISQLGFARYVTGDDQGAAEAYQTILDIDASNADAWFSLGMIRFGKEDYAAAETCFKRAVEITGGDAQGWNNLGVCLYQQQRIEDAKICFCKALEIDPADEDAQFNLANLG